MRSKEQSFRTNSTRIGRFAAILVAALGMILHVTQSEAQLNVAGTNCYKVKDDAKLVATVEFSQALLGVSQGCRLRSRAQLLCTSGTAEFVSGEPAAPNNIASSTGGASLCYKMKCSKASVPDVAGTDLFTQHALTRLKPGWFCAPVDLGERFDVVLGIDAPQDLSALQIRVSAADTAGAFGLNGEAEACSFGTAVPEDALSMATLEDGNAEAVVVAPSANMILPGNLATCQFISVGGAPQAGDFAVSVIDASGSEGSPLSGVTVGVSAITPSQ